MVIVHFRARESGCINRSVTQIPWIIAQTFPLVRLSICSHTRFFSRPLTWLNSSTAHQWSTMSHRLRSPSDPSFYILLIGKGPIWYSAPNGRWYRRCKGVLIRSNELNGSLSSELQITQLVKRLSKFFIQPPKTSSTKRRSRWNERVSLWSNY